ncbi:MAG: GDP-mannose 3,5-epimerase [Bacteroidetes bacterium]|nr:GDP-mannose 3,5-epimerase [Bacteroidota bacterium]
MKKALVLGAGGFIGSHLTRKLKLEGWYVRGVDIHEPEFSENVADEFVTGDLRERVVCDKAIDGRYDRVYQLAADMGGAGYIFTGAHDAAIMANSAQINLNVLHRTAELQPGLLFYSSSACIYPAPAIYHDDVYEESTAYPAQPDSEYGWEKLFSERLYLAHARNAGLNVRIARLHNVYGPEAAWDGGREKAIAAICRKVILAKDGDEIEIWGDGQQTRSFLYIDECLEGMERLMVSSLAEPVNIGSAEMVTIQALTEMIIGISGKQIAVRHIDGPKGVDIRTSNNNLIKQKLNWSPEYPLRNGVKKTYQWIASKIAGQSAVHP